jgi:hypothetical protein
MMKLIRLAGLALLLATSLSAQARMDDVKFAEALVRADHVEGLPYGEARKVTPGGVARLIEMLADPVEARHRVHIVMALGISGSDQAYPALAAFQASEPEGEIDGAQYRARRSLPLAMGHLARSDPRARSFLLEAARTGRADSAPTWSYRHLRGEKLVGILQRAAIMGLAISGRPEAAAALRQLDAELDPQASDELRFHLLEARSLCDRVMREGPERVFDPPRRP